MIFEQVRRNAVAIISLVVALSGLGYNTWRNELTEANRNVRQVGLFMMKELTELQEVILYAKYDHDDERGDIKTGWPHVLAVKDLSYSVPAEIKQSAEQLANTWSEHSSGLDQDKPFSYKAVDSSIDVIKKEIVLAISQLD